MILSDTPLRTQHAFNEMVYGSIYRQRSNTLSNLGYVLVGLYVIAYACWDYRRPTSESDPYAVRQPALMVYFGFTCIVLGLGSGLMHAAMTSWGHKLDVLGIDPREECWSAGSGAAENRDRRALTALVDALVDERRAARAARDFAVGDAIRDRLQAAGIVLEDGPDGTRWSLT